MGGAGAGGARKVWPYLDHCVRNPPGTFPRAGRWVPARRGRGVAVRRFSLLFVIYIIVGIIVAFSKNQITAPFLKDLVEALLYVLLWPLSLLGLVNLNL